MASTALTTNKNTTIAQHGEMPVQAIVDRKRKLVEVMEAVMKDGEHYGRIPGSNKPSLLKAGAEILATVFGLAPSFKITRTELPGGHREYEITCTLVHFASGNVLGDGLGSCSTMESKYRWRKRGSERVENPDIADVYNTVLKMAKKRAQIDATLTVVGASDILAQDLEDLPEGSRTDPPLHPTTHPIATQGRTANSQPPARPADPPKPEGPPLTEADMVELLAEISKCTKKGPLKKLANERVMTANLTPEQRDRLKKAFESQFDDIDAIEEDERAAAGGQS